MFNPTKIEESLFGIVGCKNPYNPDYSIVSAENQASRSGYFVTDNPFAKIEYHYDTVDIENATPTQYNEILARLQKSAIVNVCNRVFEGQPSYMDRNLLYMYPFNKVDLENLAAPSFGGLKINVAMDKNVAFKIPRVFLNFSGTGDVTLMLFNTAQHGPIESKTITIDSTHQEEELNWVVDNTEGFYKGDFYLGYLTDGLTVTPFKRNYNMSNIKSAITHLEFQDIIVSGHNVAGLFNLDDVEGSDNNWGINPDITVYTDYTDMIMNNQHLFGYGVYLQMSIQMISAYGATLRSNRNQRVTSSFLTRAKIEIEGTSKEVTPRVKGLQPTLNDTLENLKGEIDKLKRGYFGDGLMVETLC